MSEVPPVLLSSIICDRVIFDRISGMPSLINIIQTVNAPRFPVASSLVFFCELTNGHGKTQTSIRIIDCEQNDRAIFEQAGEVNFKNVQQVMSLALNLHGIKFEHPGQYRFQLFAGDTLLGERRIFCRKIEPRPHQNTQNDTPIS